MINQSIAVAILVFCLSCGIHMPRALDQEASSGEQGSPSDLADLPSKPETPSDETKQTPTDPLPLEPEPQPSKPVVTPSCSAPLDNSALVEGQIDGRRINLFDAQAASHSLCQTLESHKKSVAVFQLSSILCFTCQDEAEYLESALTDQGLRDHVLHAIVFTDAREDWAEDDFLWFLETFAISAKRLHDDGLKMIRQFSVEPSKPRLPTIVVMNSKMKAIVLNQDGVSGKDILKAVTELMEANEE
ncbi:hypothetical protein [Pseudobacteriovorax antillogorgiicola]|uniref:Thioredoxin domain-containing protein n=1 Tax=Pseudobacteriovorax antillogorgiicola TaxID=1513793 RepID=A0A1Y6C622_9BACT|nr:hypothetical protein [Pseudobacteriovorax antillogorgiicola]TCS49906.1 hypothetical protein EDD56_114151 [Pseudobacteriovorax antillogorgiicola]SMF44836.1 hypothetical protein SAMN06296036_113156 [Pseudobacteriovorax antillogorgiicola]